MPYAFGFVRYGLFKKKNLDYIIPAEVFRFFAGKKPSKEDISNYITELIHGTAEIKPIVSSAINASVEPHSLVGQEKNTSENTPEPISITKPQSITAPSEIQQLKKRSTLSISNIMSQKEKKAASVSPTEVRTRAFSINELTMLWSSFSEKEKKAGRIGIFTAMKGADIYLGEKNTINISVSSIVASNEIENNILDILEFLKRELQNDTITHNIIITDTPKEHMPYLPKEKYEYLTKKNPKIETLRASLGLNIEF